MLSTLFVALLVGSSRANISPEECEDALFHMDPDNCPYSYYRCYHVAGVIWLLMGQSIYFHQSSQGRTFLRRYIDIFWAHLANQAKLLAEYCFVKKSQPDIYKKIGTM